MVSHRNSMIETEITLEEYPTFLSKTEEIAVIAQLTNLITV